MKRETKKYILPSALTLGAVVLGGGLFYYLKDKSSNAISDHFSIQDA